MNLSSSTTNLLTVVVVLLIAYFLFKNQSQAVHNEGNLSYNDADETVESNVNVNLSEETDDESMGGSEESEESVEETVSVDKFARRNMSKDGDKKINYRDAKRATGGEWSTHLDKANNLINDSHVKNDKFSPMEQNAGEYASYSTEGKVACKSGEKCDVEDLFNADNYLPKEQNDDWFEVPKDAVSVKNRHLINVVKPFGVDSIGSHNKNSSYDLRRAPINPKFETGPWLNSSIEPDLLRKELC